MSKDRNGGRRSLYIKVRTAKGRKKSSTLWLERQLNDPYVHKAHDEGFRSRAAYKLIEMDQKFELLKNNSTIIDLGAAPGSWLQVTAKKTVNSRIIGLDLLKIDPINNVTTLQCDFTSDEGYELLTNTIGTDKVDLVLSDMAPSACGHAQTDHIRIMDMCGLALDFAKKYLNNNGNFVAKVLKGGTEKSLLEDMKKNFKIVKHYKPDASRKESSETYVIALGFKKVEE